MKFRLKKARIMLTIVIILEDTETTETTIEIIIITIILIMVTTIKVVIIITQSTKPITTAIREITIIQGERTKQKANKNLLTTSSKKPQMKTKAKNTQIGKITK